MPELKRSFEAAGFGHVKTVLSSGNVVFSARKAPEASLERRAEAAMNDVLGRGFLTIVRPLDHIDTVLASQPYRAFELPVAAKLVVTFLREEAGAPTKLPLELDGASILCVHGREVFSAYVPNPRGPVFMTLIEKTFGERQTTRTWGTLEKVVRALQQSNPSR
jgi:uncharacterized protein (DUF1697 family)